MAKIYIAGHLGLVGSALVREVEATSEHEWIGESRDQLDLLEREAVRTYMSENRPDMVVIAAAKVGGIAANDTYPVEFLSENLRIATNLLDACHQEGTSRVLFLGSSCIYPRMAPQPIREEYLLTGELEPTNEAYALAKISGLKLVQAYRRQYGHDWIAAMPTNLYGPNDNFDLESSHVLPAMIRKFHEAKIQKKDEVVLWGSGSPRREFLHVDDLARACLFLLSNYSESTPINVGTGVDVAIRELAGIVRDAVGFEGRITWDTSRPDGTPRKLLDVTKINRLGWKYQVKLEDGISDTYEWFKANHE